MKVGIPPNAKYIGYECVPCGAKIDEDERQNIIALGCVQTWCLLCQLKRDPSNRLLAEFVRTNGKDDTILAVNKLLNER
jgi:hypothetical protein